MSCEHKQQRPECQEAVKSTLALFAKQVAEALCDGCAKGLPPIKTGDVNVHFWHEYGPITDLCRAEKVFALVPDPNALAAHDAALRSRGDMFALEGVKQAQHIAKLEADNARLRGLLDSARYREHMAARDRGAGHKEAVVHCVDFPCDEYHALLTEQPETHGKERI